MVLPRCNHLVPSRGVTHRVSSFVTALTQFLDASDLCRLDRVCCEDHAALDALWNTCAAKCNGHVPLAVLRLQSSDPRGGGEDRHHPRDTAYLWSVAWKQVNAWFHAVRSENRSCAFGSSVDLVLSLRLRHEGCLYCQHLIYMDHRTFFHVHEFRQNLLYGAGFQAGSLWNHTLNECRYLHNLWIGVCDEKRNMDRSTTACTTALLRVLLVLGPHIGSVQVGEISGARPSFIDLWVGIGVLPRIPLLPQQSTHSQIDWV